MIQKAIQKIQHQFEDLSMPAQAAHDSDQQLVERVQHGDKRAFDLLVLKYQHKIIGVVKRYIRDSAETHDVVQETFIKAYRALATFRGDSAFYTWLYRIGINTAKNYLVSKGRGLPLADIDTEEAEYLSGNDNLKDLDTPENNLFRDELQRAVYTAINELPKDLRSALMLREMEGMSYEEIAEIMDCPVGTVRSRIFRARESIDKIIDPLMSYEQ